MEEGFKDTAGRDCTEWSAVANGGHKAANCDSIDPAAVVSEAEVLVQKDTNNAAVRDCTE